MSQRIKQINELLLAELAALVSEQIQFKEGLVTITSVKTSPDLKNARIFISVMPENVSGSALKVLRKNSKNTADSLRSRLSLKYIPRLSWHIDEKIKYMIEIDKVLKQIEEEDKQNGTTI